LEKPQITNLQRRMVTNHINKDCRTSQNLSQKSRLNPRQKVRNLVTMNQNKVHLNLSLQKRKMSTKFKMRPKFRMRPKLRRELLQAPPFLTQMMMNSVSVLRRNRRSILIFLL